MEGEKGVLEEKKQEEMPSWRGVSNLRVEREVWEEQKPGPLGGVDARMSQLMGIVRRREKFGSKSNGHNCLKGGKKEDFRSKTY